MEQNLSLSFIIQVHMLRREGYKQSTGNHEHGSGQLAKRTRVTQTSMCKHCYVFLTQT